MKILLAILLLFSASAVSAHNIPCIGTDPHKDLIDKNQFDEQALVTGLTRQGHTVTLYLAATGKWSLVLKSAEKNVWCLLEQGSAMRPFVPSPQGSM